MTVKLSDIKKLFALSSNRCAFVDCTMEIILKNIVLGEVCHIKAQSPGGPRFDSDLSSEQIHALENLILLCPTHHKIIDSDVSTYTADVLHRMKQGHEEKSSECIDIDDESLQRLLGNFNVEQNNITSIAPLAIGSNLNSTINVTVNQTANKEQVMELI